jgi:hypothetical protein
MKSFLAGSFLLIALGVLWAASIPFAYECSKEAGFIMDPNDHKRIGYVTELDGIGLTQPLSQDLQVNLPFKPIPGGIGSDLRSIQMVNGHPTAKVVGVLENFAWDGGVGGSIKLEFWVSKENMALLKAATSSGLKNTMVSAIGWSIADFDQETKTWYAAAKPVRGALKGTISGGTANPELNIDPNPELVKDGIDVNVYKVTLQIVPNPHEPNQLLFANSSAKSMTKVWGMQ